MTVVEPAENIIAANDEEVGKVSGIPVRNLWLLMLYASRIFRTLQKVTQVEVEENPDDIPDLVAEILCHHVERRIRRNLSYGYQHREAVLDRVRGRIDMLKTERHLLLNRGKVACRFDELTVNTARNCLVRAALEKISKIVRNDNLAHKCRSLAVSMKHMGVIGECPDPRSVLLDRFGLQDADDRPMVVAAHLTFDLALPTETAGTRYMSPPSREVTWIRKLYEKGIAGFYDVMLSDSGWQVEAGKRIYWPIQEKTPLIDKIFPSMQTDIILNNVDQKNRIVIDTKFTSVVGSSEYREETLHSGYIYQIYAYLRSQEDYEDPLAAKATGLLLHPSVGKMVNESVVIQSHKIQFATVDLAVEAKEIRKQLLQIIGVSPLD